MTEPSVAELVATSREINKRRIAALEQVERAIQATETTNQSNQSNEYILLAKGLSVIANIPMFDPDPYWQTDIGQTCLFYQNLVIGQYVRDFIDRDFNGWLMPKHWEKKTKSQIRLEAQVLGQAWKLIQLAHQSSEARVLKTCGLILEQKLLLFEFHEKPTLTSTGEKFLFWALACLKSRNSSKKDEFLVALLLWVMIFQLLETPTATRLVRDQQSANRILQSLNNPFAQEVSPVTWRFVQHCLSKANMNKDFYQDWQNLIQTRMSLVNHIQLSHPKRFDKNGVLKEKRGRGRGRKSIPPSRSRSG